ncbi:MAG: cyclase family protein [Cyclobacteriaceae bacterium]
MEKQINYSHPIDITLRLDQHTILYPGDPPVSIKNVLQISKGDALNLSEFGSLGLHAGTHIDLPAHFLEQAKCLDQYVIDNFVGMAVVIEIFNTNIIRTEDLPKLELPRNTHILLKTDNSDLLNRTEFTSDYCYLSEDASRQLVSYAPASIGIDYYSLDPATSTSFEAHKIMARADVPVYVCLDLRKVDPGPYYFMGLPLALSEVEASPVRAVLFPTLS